MDKRELLYYWGSVDAVTRVVKGETKTNEWGEANATSFEAYHIGPDEVVLYNTPTETVIAINGSDGDREEWRGNFAGYPITKGCHGNFYEAGIRILETVLVDIPKGKTVTIVGHSRGGALAQVATMRGRQWHGLRVRCVTFGSPRPFTFRKARSLRFTHVRVHCDGDIVCHIPAVWMWPLFKSYETESVRIRPGRILGLRKKHGEYGEMITKYLPDA